MSQRRNRLAAELSLFAQQYRRKAQRNTEPNDRKYSREVEAEMKRLPPEELSSLLSGDDEDAVPEVRSKTLKPTLEEPTLNRRTRKP